MTGDGSTATRGASQFTRRRSFGAEPDGRGGAHFRVWAPKRKIVEVVLEPDAKRARPGPTGLRAVKLERGERGVFTGHVADAPIGSRYRYRVDGEGPFADPASRFQPEGPHGASELVDPAAFRWTDGAWKGVSLRGQVIYELHIGTFTREGTFAAAQRELDELARLGITLLEVMPLSDFPGRFGWGYDGVNLYAPCRLYGAPDDVRRFVDRAHALGIGVLLDVVYNHLGPDGNYLAQFSDQYFSKQYKTDWGEPLNFDGEGSADVREFFCDNAAYWIDEFHFDGLRLDATQSIFDASDEHIIAAVGERARQAAGGRSIVIVAENEPQHTRLVRPREEGGFGLDGLWNDDWHHSAIVAATGRRGAYYTDTRGTPQELISATKWGYLFQGQRYAWQTQRRGSPAFGLPAEAFVIYLDNHDQIANSGRAERIHRMSSPGRVRALTTLMFVAPGTPMLFQGQEFASSAPFFYFADHQGELGGLVQKGRLEFLCQFPGMGMPDMQSFQPAPNDPATFERCKLDFREREAHAESYALHADLIRLRREDPVIRAQSADRMHGAVLAGEAFALRFFGEGGDDRLVVVNLGSDLHEASIAEPLLAPPEGMRWRTVFTSESPRYGGGGTAEVDGDECFHVPAHATLVLAPRRNDRKSSRPAGEP